MPSERSGLHADSVAIGVLVTTAFAPLPLEGILKALGNLGAPTWRPVAEVVVNAVERLIEERLLEASAAPSDGHAAARAPRLQPSARARERLPSLLRTLPLSSLSPDIVYRLKIMGLDLLDPETRAGQLRELTAHWQGLLALWQHAEERCPCAQASVRRWMGHNAALARMEIEWLASLSPQPEAPPPKRGEGYGAGFPGASAATSARQRAQ